MGILNDIQAAILEEKPDLGTILLKLRLLASRLGSDELGDWVKHEAEGYPRSVDVPSYRIVGVSYHGTWSGPYGGGISNAPIPAYLIEKHASSDWTHYKVRESIAGVQEMASGSNTLGINAANLILVLQGKIYKDWACNAIHGEISHIALSEIIQSVRARILELTIELERRVPEAAQFTLQSSLDTNAKNAATVTQIFNQTIYGNLTQVNASDGAQVALAITAGDAGSMIGELIKAGLPETEAKQIAEIIAAERPSSPEEPVGGRGMSWIKKNAPKVASGAWKIGSPILADLVREAAFRYWGLK